MKEKLQWFRTLPFFLALSFFFLFSLRKLLRMEMGTFFSQTGEDIIIQNLLGKKQGIYLDIGCNEPMRLSNTFALYLQGWRGICVDANSEIVSRFQRIRRLDTVICAAVSDKIEEVIFYKSETNAVSTINTHTFLNWEQQWSFLPEKRETVVTTTLNDILSKHIVSSQEIDLLSIDIEGHDFQALKGIDLNIYRPKLICIEIHNFIIDKPTHNEIYNYLLEHNYSLYGYITMNAYFIDNQKI